jgi:hypothetical protein
VDATKDDGRFLRIWPPQIAAAWWPPFQRLGPFDVANLREQWGHAPETVGGNFPPVRVEPLRDLDR